MARTFTGTSQFMRSASAPFTGQPAGMGVWVNAPTASQQTAQYIGVTDGTNTNRYTVGSDPTAASGKASMFLSSATLSEQALSSAAGTSSTWQLYLGSIGPFPNNGSVWLNGANKGSVTGNVNPSGLNTLQIGGRGTQQEAHAFTRLTGWTDLEAGYLNAFGNPQALGLAHYYYVNSSGTENDLIGSLNLTVTGATAGSNDPNLATWFTGTAIPNQAWTQGSAITTIDLTTKFDNGVASLAPWTGSLMQVGNPGTATSANGANAGASSNALTVNSATGITAGMWVKVGSNNLAWVLFVSGNSLLLSAALTWNNADTVTPYPVSALTTLTSNGVTVNGSNVVTGTPLAGAVGTFANCFVMGKNNVNSGAIAYSNLFNIAVASSGVAPSFSAGPSLASTQTDGQTYNATSTQTATWWQGAYLRGSATPTSAQIVAGTGTGFASHFSTALTLNVAGSNTSTGLTNPIYDIHHCLTNGNGNSAVVSFPSQIKAPPAGKQYFPVTLGVITAITKANPAKVTQNGHGRTTGDWVEVFDVGGMTQINGTWVQCTVVDANNVTLNGIDSTGFTTYTSGGKMTWGRSCFNGSSTPVLTGDVAVADTVDAQGNALTFTAEGVAIFATSSLARQSFTIDTYSVSLGALIGSAPGYENDLAPAGPGQTNPFPALFFTLNQSQSQDVSGFFTDPQADAVTVTALSSLPAGRSLSGNSLVGIATTTAITAVTFQAANVSGESTQSIINIVDGLIPAPNGAGLTQDGAAQLAAVNYMASQFGSQPDPTPGGPAPAGTVIGQSPPVGIPMVPGATIFFSLSDGTAPASNPVAPTSGVFYSTQLSQQQQIPLTLSLSYLTGANPFECQDVCAAGSTDIAGSVYRYFTVPSNARIVDLQIMNDANPSNTSYKCGVYKGNGGPVPVPGADAIFFPSGTPMDVARNPWVSIYKPATVGGVYQLANLSKRIWELLGLTGDPHVQYELAITAVTPGQAGGMMALRLIYVQ